MTNFKTPRGATTRHLLLLALLSFCFFFIGLGWMFNLSNPDEVFYAGSAREMAQQHAWLTAYLFGAPQFEKPIMLYWLLRIGQACFGETAFAYRFFPALFGAGGVLLAYVLGRLLWGDARKALLCGLVLLSAGLYIAMARTVFTDLIFSVWIAGAFTGFYAAYARPACRWGMPLCYACCGLAALTKTPLALVLVVAAVLFFLWLQRGLAFLRRADVWWGLAIFFIIAGPWYAWSIHTYGSAFLHEFFVNDHWRRFTTAEHDANDHWYFYPFSIIGGMMPWGLYSAVALVLACRRLRRAENAPSALLIAWVAAVLLVFQFAHSKLVSYIMPLFPPVAMLTAHYIYETARQRSGKKLLAGIGIATGVLLAVVPIAGCIYLKSAAERHPELAQFAHPGLLLMLALACLALLGVMHAWLGGSGKIIWSIGALLAFFPVALAGAAGARPQIDAIVSSQAAWESFAQRNPPPGDILCSKRFLRGIRFYSQRPVASIDLGGSDFFSPHPVPFISNSAQLAAWLKGRGKVGGVLEEHDAHTVQAALPAGYKLKMLHTVGRACLVRITGPGQ